MDVTSDGPTTLDRALGEGVDLILLDIGLPELDGLERCCRRVRAGGYAVPVLILTARADEVDTVVGLDAGADDYVTKPFRLAELLARVRVGAGAHSLLELRYLRDVERPHGLPAAQRQARARLGSRNAYRDVLYEQFGVAVETDGAVAHPPEARWRDRERDNASARPAAWSRCAMDGRPSPSGPAGSRPRSAPCCAAGAGPARSGPAGQDAWPPAR